MKSDYLRRDTKCFYQLVAGSRIQSLRRSLAPGEGPAPGRRHAELRPRCYQPGRTGTGGLLPHGARGGEGAPAGSRLRGPGYLRRNQQLQAARSAIPQQPADTDRLIKAAMRALDAIWRPGFAYKKAGTVMIELVPAVHVQTGLLSGRTMRARPRACGGRRAEPAFWAWNDRLRRGRRAPRLVAAPGVHSQRYTTAWGELLRV